MGKRTYLAPVTKTVHINSENLMLIASPGIDGNYDPTKPIESKGSDFFEEDEADGTWPANNLWDE